MNATKQRFEEIARRIASAAAGSARDVRLVAVSKMQPIEAIVEMYRECGQRVFGENYIKELLQKSSDERILSECPDIEWRFIGRLQTNKVNQILRVNRLKAIESLDSLKLAQILQKGLQSSGRRMDVMIQINTSQEDTKSGVMTSDALPLITAIREQCPNLTLEGLMTIGSAGHDLKDGPNPDFVCLVECARSLEQKIGIPLKLSFGMSDDFEHAVALGSDEVRIGSALFGPRNKI